MLTPEQQERLEIIRRIAERGKEEAEYRQCDVEYYKDGYGTFIDLFVHILDELKRIA